jgi:hypothetical protein
MRVSPSSFVQVQDQDAAVSLLRGGVYVQAFGDDHAFRALTPNARAQMKMGSALLLYDPEKQRTQWVVLDQIGSLENRFTTEDSVVVREGESSVLDLDHERVVPDQPKAITIASLKPILKSLAIPEKKMARALRVALERQRRVFPATFTRGIEGEQAVPLDEHAAPASTGRAPASEPVVGTSAELAAGESTADYRRSESSAEALELKERFHRKVLAGTGSKKTQKYSRVREAEALEQRLIKTFRARQSHERENLLKELGRIPTSVEP